MFFNVTLCALFVNNEAISRDQNFGINDLAAIQDVRNEFSLQDIDESAASKDRGNKFIYIHLNTSKTLRYKTEFKLKELI